MNEHRESMVGRVRTRALHAAVVTAGLMGVAGVASATPPTINEQFGVQATAAKDSALDVLTSNILVLLALPVAWVGYKVVRKVIAKIG